MCYVVETYVYIDKRREGAFFNRIMYVFSLKNSGDKESLQTAQNSECFPAALSECNRIIKTL